MTEQQSPKRAKTDPDLVGVAEDAIDLEAEMPEFENQNEADAALEQELRNAQALLDNETEEMMEKIRQVEQEYDKRKWPLYKARGEWIKQIPGFWLHCFLQHEDLKLVLGQVDQEILGSLVELEVEPFGDAKAGYKMVMRFAENEYFEDQVLEKEVRFLQEEGQGMLCSISGCQPTWKNGDPTKAEPERQGRKRGREPASFFRWWTEESEFDAATTDPLADIIKEQLWVNPLLFMDAADADEEQDFGEEYEEEEGYEGEEGQQGVYDLEGDEDEEEAWDGAEQEEGERLTAEGDDVLEGEPEEYADYEEGGQETGTVAEEPGGEEAEAEAQADSTHEA